jgi:hypothetical protein
MTPTCTAFTSFGYGSGDVMATINTKVRFASQIHNYNPYYTCWAARYSAATQPSNTVPVECDDMREMHK